MTGQRAQKSWGKECWKTRKGQPVQESLERTTGGTVWKVLYSQDRTRQPEHESKDRTEGTAHPGQDNSDKTSVTVQL